MPTATAELDEDLDLGVQEIGTKNKAAAQTTLESKRTGTAAKAPAAEAYDEDEVEFGDEDVMAGGDGLDKIAPEGKNVVRVALLNDMVKAKFGWVHFVTDQFPFRCHSARDKRGVIQGKPAECCVKFKDDKKQKAALTVAVLALLYANANPETGKYPAGPDGKAQPIQWSLGWIKLSWSGFRRVSKLVEEDAKPWDMDFTIGKKDGGKGVGYEYAKIASKARFRLNPDLLAEVRAAVEKVDYGDILNKKIGRRITPLELKALLAGLTGSASADGAPDVDDMSDL